MAVTNYDYLIIGAGIIGMSTAKRIRECRPEASILIIDKEKAVARHASSRNSGVLHAGFYYSADSLKAKFCVEGNKAMKDFARQHHLRLNECGKLVVAQNEEELSLLEELQRRGKKNKVKVKLISEQEARALEPNARTFKKALYSPETASIDPQEVCFALKGLLELEGVDFQLNCAYQNHNKNTLETSRGEFQAKVIINCAGLYADQIAKDFGFGKHYTIIPFKGLYLKYTKDPTALNMNIYPVPNLKNPFLGVHFTKTVDGGIKIGPTAVPALWRENYAGFSKFNLAEFLNISLIEARLYFTNAFGFRSLANEERRKYNRKYFIKLAGRLVQNMDPKGYGKFTPPGIRAQLLDTRTNRLLNDFVVEGDGQSVHVLNAVSPAFTCAFSFARYLCQNHLKIRPKRSKSFK